MIGTNQLHLCIAEAIEAIEFFLKEKRFSDKDFLVKSRKAQASA